jgi:orotate phosphoribosyltransferase
VTSEEVLEALEEAGAVRHGHFKLTSGLHSDTYIQTARVLENPYMARALAGAAAEPYLKRSIDLVVAPAVGGIVFGYAVADALGARFIYAERVKGKMTFRRNFRVHASERVIVAEDVVTTGGSVREVVDLVRQAGGDVAGVVAVVDRSAERDFEAPFSPLVTFQLEAHDPAKCPMCEEGRPIDSPGSRQLAAEEAAEAD